MSDDEFETNFFGTALPELPNDVIPTKKPITVADQIAVDANGKRRFHGAFTGGFSAGYWNTVGSQEGWKPKEFKSSRSEKASRVTQNANDFMDDEDVGEFGINPQRIQTTNDFTSGSAAASRTADHQPKDNPVLNLFLMPAKDRASVALLKRMGWRENKDGNVKRSRRLRQRKPDLKVYQCSMGPIENAAVSDVPHSVADAEVADVDSDDSVESVTFNPDDYEELTLVPKINRFGLGYRGLQSERDTASSSSDADAKHVNLFAAFEVVDRKNQKKLSIRGQAFGVGAFEEDDDDIYALDDMSTYNFETTKRSAQQLHRNNAAPVKYHQTIEGFKPIESQSQRDAKRMYTVSMPRDFRPRNWLQRMSRFAPAVDAPKELDDGASARLGRHMLTPDQRGQLLGTSVPKSKAPASSQPAVSNAKPAAADILSSFDNRFVSTKPEAPPANFTPGLQPPTAANDDTQKRLAALFSKNFVSASEVRTDEPPTTTVKTEPVVEQPPAKKVVEYVVQMKRDVTVWLPCPMLLQKMNIEDPSRGPATSKGSSTPFSLLKHVNLSARSRRNEKEFTSGKTMLTDLSDTPNAYVPKPPVVAVTPAQSKHVTEDGTAARVDEEVRPPSTVTTAVDTMLVQPRPVVPVRPKSELEQSVCRAVDTHPAEKKDLFKAIFESSDEEEDNDDADIGHNVPAQPNPISSGRSTVSAHLPNVVENLNILRNTSPPRGIFSALPKLQKPVDQPAATASDRTDRSNTSARSAIESTTDVYGPTLPRLTKADQPKSATSSDVGHRKRSHSSSSSGSDEWIVADKAGKDESSSSRRKHKKQKMKHKKSKSKSKKCKKEKKHKK